MRVIPRLSAGVWTSIGSALIASAFVAAPVTAYSQNNNAYPSSPVTCDNSADYLCVEWAKTSGNLSINVDVYLSSTLVQSVDLRTDVRNAMSEYNGIAARNPHLQVTNTTTNDEMYLEASSSLPAGTYARSTWSWNPTTTKLTRCDTVFNAEVAWNRSLDFDVVIVNGETIYHADARKVANHEMGHCEALGHVGGSTAAIMHQGATTYYHVQTDDKNGIIHIYGAYP